jgi:hypothetical protein
MEHIWKSTAADFGMHIGNGNFQVHFGHVGKEDASG